MRNLITIISLLILSACITEVEFKAKDLKTKLVVNSINHIDSVFMVQVTSSKLIPGPDTSMIRFLPNAKVKLSANGKEIETLTFNTINNKPYYLSQSKVEEGVEYSLEVSHQNFTTANGNMKVPTKINILSIDTVSITVNQNDYIHQKFKVTIKFNDEANVPNFYRLNVKSTIGENYGNYYYDDKGSLVDTGIVVININEAQSYYIESDDPVFQQQQGAYDELFSSIGNRYNLFTDELFDGKNYELSFFLDSYMFYQLDQIDEEQFEFFRMDIELYSLCEDTYRYIKSVGESNDYMPIIMSEPVQVYSNITNGLGVFGGNSISSFNYSKGEYPVEGVEYRKSNFYYY